MDNIEPKLKPLIADLHKIDFGAYLITTDFDRYCIENEIEDAWDECLKFMKQNKRVFSIGIDLRKWDYMDALKIWLHHNFNSKLSFDSLVYLLLNGFILWNKREESLDDIFKDLQLIDFPNERLKDLETKHYKKQEEIKMQQTNQVSNSKTNEDEEIINSKKIAFEAKKDEWIQKIAEDEVEMVINELKEFTLKDEYKKYTTDIVNITSRWHRVQKLRLKNTHNFDELNQEMNKINEALINLIQEIKISIF